MPDVNVTLSEDVVTPAGHPIGFPLPRIRAIKPNGKSRLSDPLDQAKAGIGENMASST